MELPTIKPESATPALRALAVVARCGESGLERPQRAILDAVQRLFLETDHDIESLAPITPEALADHLRDDVQARHLVRLMVVMSLADGPPSEAQMSLLSGFSAALGVREPSVDVIRHLSKGRTLRFRLAFMSHSHIRNYLRNTYRMLGGVRPMIATLLRFRGVLGEDPELVSRFRALEQLPENTLGHRFYRHCTEEGLPFPGEKGGFPIGAIYHDFTHVLAGYDTSPEGELQAAAFQAGYAQDEDAFFTALFAIVIHTAGINLAPFPMPVLRGRIGQDGLALDVLHALQRGAEMKTDLGSDWDCWKYVELPLDEARTQLGVPPRNASLH